MYFLFTLAFLKLKHHPQNVQIMSAVLTIYLKVNTLNLGGVLGTEHPKSPLSALLNQDSDPSLF